MYDPYLTRGRLNQDPEQISSTKHPGPQTLRESGAPRRRVKFGAFQEYLECKHGERFDRIASGHYARVLREPQGPLASEPPLTRLALTSDAVKDQTYFLAHLSQVQ